MADERETITMAANAAKNMASDIIELLNRIKQSVQLNIQQKDAQRLYDHLNDGKDILTIDVKSLSVIPEFEKQLKNADIPYWRMPGQDKESSMFVFRSDDLKDIMYARAKVLENLEQATTVSMKELYSGLLKKNTSNITVNSCKIPESDIEMIKDLARDNKLTIGIEYIAESPGYMRIACEPNRNKDFVDMMREYTMEKSGYTGQKKEQDFQVLKDVKDAMDKKIDNGEKYAVVSTRNINDKIIVTDKGFELYQNNELTTFKSADDIDYKERLDEMMPMLERPVIMSLQEEKEEILKKDVIEKEVKKYPVYDEHELELQEKRLKLLRAHREYYDKEGHPVIPPLGEQLKNPEIMLKEIENFNMSENEKAELREIVVDDYDSLKKIVETSEEKFEKISFEERSVSLEGLTAMVDNYKEEINSFESHSTFEEQGSR